MTRVKLRHLDKTMIIDSLAHTGCVRTAIALVIFMRRTPLKVERDRQIFRIAKKRHWLILTPNLRKMIFLDFEKLSVDTGFRTKDCLAVKLSALHWDEFNIV